MIEDKNNQGGYIIPEIYFNPKRGWIAYYCRKIGKYLWLLGHEELHPYAALMEAITKTKVEKK